jgi:hypothetical protein
LKFLGANKPIADNEREIIVGRISLRRSKIGGFDGLSLRWLIGSVFDGVKPTACEFAASCVSAATCG